MRFFFWSESSEASVVKSKSQGVNGEPIHKRGLGEGKKKRGGEGFDGRIRHRPARSTLSRPSP